MDLDKKTIDAIWGGESDFGGANMSELLRAENFYSKVKGPEKLLEFCQVVHDRYADKLGIPPQKVIYDPAIKDKEIVACVRYNQDPHNRPLNLNMNFRHLLAQRSRKKEPTFPYFLFETILHETKHLEHYQITDNFMTNYDSLEYDQDYLIGASKLTEQFTTAWQDSETKDKPWRAKVGKLIKKARSDSYNTNIMEIDARQYPIIELVNIFNESHDPAILSLLEEYVRNEAKIREQSRNLSFPLYKIPWKLSDAMNKNEPKRIPLVTHLSECVHALCNHFYVPEGGLVATDPFYTYINLVSHEAFKLDESFEQDESSAMERLFNIKRGVSNIINPFPEWEDLNTQRMVFEKMVMDKIEKNALDFLFPIYITLQKELEATHTSKKSKSTITPNSHSEEHHI